MLEKKLAKKFRLLDKKLAKKFRKLFGGIGKRSAGVELLPGIDVRNLIFESSQHFNFRAMEILISLGSQPQQHWTPLNVVLRIC